MTIRNRLVFRNKSECLEEFARTFGVYIPKNPIPEWWDLFLDWSLKNEKAQMISTIAEILVILSVQEEKGNWKSRPEWMNVFDVWYDKVCSHRFPDDHRIYLNFAPEKGLTLNDYNFWIVRHEQFTYQQEGSESTGESYDQDYSK